VDHGQKEEAPRALTPASAIRLNEIVEEIVEHLRPWKDRMGEATVTARMNGELRLLLLFTPLEATRANRTQNRIHAQQLDDALHRVEKLLTSAPFPLGLFLLNPLPMMTEGGGLMPEKTPSIEGLERANRKRADSFGAELKRLRQVCARGVGSGFGYHPNYDPTKYFCAFFAYGWMKGYSDRPITGTEDGAFRIITSLTYEAVSGQPEADLKRACDSCLRKSGAPPS
jgi:hypothetical protein